MNTRKSVSDRLRRLYTATAEKLTASQLSALWALTQLTLKNPAAPIRLDESNEKLAEAIVGLVECKMVVRGDRTNIVRLVYPELDADGYRYIAETIVPKFFPEGAPQPPKKVAAAEKVNPTNADGPALDWAFRRLRRQATIFFSSGDVELQKELRAKLNTVNGSYHQLMRAFTEDDNSLITIAEKFATTEVTSTAISRAACGWDNFMEWFFGHTIHPGSRAK